MAWACCVRFWPTLLIAQHSSCSLSPQPLPSPQRPRPAGLQRAGRGRPQLPRLELPPVHRAADGAAAGGGAGVQRGQGAPCRSFVVHSSIFFHSLCHRKKRSRLALPRTVSACSALRLALLTLLHSTTAPLRRRTRAQVAQNFSNYSAWHYRSILLHRLHCAPPQAEAEQAKLAAQLQSLHLPAGEEWPPLASARGSVPLACWSILFLAHIQLALCLCLHHKSTSLCMQAGPVGRVAHSLSRPWKPLLLLLQLQKPAQGLAAAALIERGIASRPAG